MHLYRSLISGALLSALPLAAGEAFENRTVRVVTGPYASNQATAFRGLLRGRLRLFAGRVRQQSPDAQVTFDLTTSDRLAREATDTVDPATDGLLGGTGIAALWGSFDRPNVATSTIFIGSAPSDSALTQRPNLFVPVDGSLTPPNVSAYEIIIEYALLRRVWRDRRPDLVLPIGSVLKARLQEVRSEGSGTGHWAGCYRAISAATTELLRRADGPSGTFPPHIPPPPPVNCR
jgi:hypothetical protein